MSADGLADKWPSNGPKRLWSRPLGEGFSSIVAEAGRLYTMYREGDEELVVALHAETGKTDWEHRYQAKPHADQCDWYGQGPNATPLILGDRIITIGFTGIMHCLDSKSGKPVWSHDLVKEFNGAIQYFGYSNSPIRYKNTIVALVGGEGYGVVALKPDDGTLVWKSKTLDVSYAAPVLINVDGQDQFVFFSPTEVIGMDPRNGVLVRRSLRRYSQRDSGHSCASSCHNFHLVLTTRPRTCWADILSVLSGVA